MPLPVYARAMPRQRAKSLVFTDLAALLAPSAWDRPAAIDAIDWDRLIEASSHQMVAPALAWRLRDDARVPKAAAEFFEAVLFLNADRNAQIRDGLISLGRALNASAIVPLLLKGSGLLLGKVYPHPGMRFIGDIDLLLEADQLHRAREILMGAGYRPIAEGDYPHLHQMPMLVHEASGIGVELHRLPITQDLATLAPVPELLDRAELLQVDGGTFRLPAPTDRIALAIAHGQIKDHAHARGVPALRALLDVAVHMQRFEAAIDWPDLLARFKRAGASPVLADTLALLDALMGMAPPFVLPTTPAAAIGRLRRTLDRSRGQRAWLTAKAMLGTVPKALARSPREQLAKLSPARWRARIRRFDPPWS